MSARSAATHLAHDPPLQKNDDDVPSSLKINESINFKTSLSPTKPVPPIYPLTSWANTSQNTVSIAFLLGCAFTLGLGNLSNSTFFNINDDKNNVDNVVNHFQSMQHAGPGAGSGSSSGPSWNRLVTSIKSPRLGGYVAIIVSFHLLEYLTTAIWNPSKVSVKSFLLEDRNHNAAHLFAFCEYLLEETLFPPKWLAYKRSVSLLAIGLMVILGAQTLRSLAMATAAANFSHLIVYTKAPDHSLVRTGIYGWSRHPSYVAFFYWALGTQIFLGNPLSFIVFCILLYRFFSHRIKVEEWYLIKFFGSDYRKYQNEVPARIPFIK